MECQVVDGITSEQKVILNYFLSICQEKKFTVSNIFSQLRTARNSLIF